MMFFLYFHKFYLRSFKAEKGVKFLPLTKLEKIVRPRVKFFEPVLQLELPPTAGSAAHPYLTFRAFDIK